MCSSLWLYGSLTNRGKNMASVGDVVKLDCENCKRETVHILKQYPMWRWAVQGWECRECNTFIEVSKFDTDSGANCSPGFTG